MSERADVLIVGAGTAGGVAALRLASYRTPEVQARLSHPGPEATPVSRFEFPEYLSEGLLDHLLAH